MGTHVVKTGLELTIMELRIMWMSEASASISQELQLQVCPNSSACVALLGQALCLCVLCMLAEPYPHPHFMFFSEFQILFTQLNRRA